jgi:ABC-type multidrug transport system fused ATPase/permease subunit
MRQMGTNRVLFKISDSYFYAATNVLEKRDKKRFVLVVLIQAFLGFMDLVGVLLIGILGALSLNGIQSKQPGDRIGALLEIGQLDGYSFQAQAAILGLLAGSLFVTRTICSIILNKKVLFFLSRKGALITGNLSRKLMYQKYEDIQSRTLYENLYSLTAGVSAVTLGVLGTVTAVLADAILLLIMSLGLFVVDPIMASITIGFYLVVGYVLYKLMSVKTRVLGEQEANLNILSNEKVVEALSLFRESVVRNRRDFYAKEIGAIRLKLANTLAELSFLPNMSKYIIESALVIGALAISAIQFLLTDALQAIATLAIFLAAGARIAPAVLRIQQGALQIKRSIASAGPTLDLIKAPDLSPVEFDSNQLATGDFEGFEPSIKLSNLSFRYRDADSRAISKINLEVKAGTVVAIVGPSGAGKTTLIDVILGILDPEEGEVEISGRSPLAAISQWPGAISYVPQDGFIHKGTISENVSLGYPQGTFEETHTWKSLQTAQLEKYVRNLPKQIQTIVGDQGSSLSGGQRQRLGIARALVTKPKLLILDEATSALDGETEANISSAIQSLRGEVTVVLIAHRLSTVRQADQVVYLENGKIVSVGTFSEVRAAVPNFDHQATLMGL